MSHMRLQSDPAEQYFSKIPPVMSQTAQIVMRAMTSQGGEQPQITMNSCNSSHKHENLAISQAIFEARKSGFLNGKRQSVNEYKSSDLVARGFGKMNKSSSNMQKKTRKVSSP